MDTSDALLLRKWLDRSDADAFADIVSRHYAMVYTTCLRILRNAAEAEDVAQECFMELARARTTIKTSLSGWLHKAAVHRSLDRIKAETRRRRREMRFVEETTMNAEPSWDDIQKHIDEAVAALPDKLREPIIYRFLEGQTQSAIAQHLGVSDSTVQYRLNKGIEGIRKFLKRRGVVASTAVLALLLAKHLAAEAAPAALTAALGKLAIAHSAGALTGVSGAGLASKLATIGSGAMITKIVLTASISLLAAAGLHYAVTSRAGQETRNAARAIKLPVVWPSAQPSDREAPRLPIAGAPALAQALQPEKVAQKASNDRVGSGQISGRVLDPTDNLARQSEVALLSEDDLHLCEKTITEDGLFSFSGLDSDTSYVLAASHKEYGTVVSQRMTVPYAGNLTGIDLHLGHGNTVYGRVTDPHGRGVGDAKVTFIPSPSRGRIGSGVVGYGPDAQTDASGSFSVPYVAPGTFIVVTMPSGYRMAQVALTMPLDSDYRDLEIVVAPLERGFISGRVCDGKGDSIAGVMVFAQNAKASVYGVTKAADDGTYIIEGLGGAESCQVSARAEGYASEWRTVPINSRNIDFVLVPSGSVSGTVVDAATGDPIQQFDVRIEKRYDSERGVFVNADVPWERCSSPRGEFLLSKGDSSLVQLAARAKGYAVATSDEIRVSDGEMVTGIEIRLERGAVVTGRVTDNTGKPLQGVDVHTFETLWYVPASLRALTDGAGRFVLHHMSPGSVVNVAAVLDGYAVETARDVHVRSEEPTEVVFQLAKEGRLIGTIRDGARPVPNLSVMADKHAPPPFFIASASTDAKGRFTIAGLPSGEYRVYAAQREPSLKWETVATVVEGETTEITFRQPDDPAGTATVLGTLMVPDSALNYEVLIRRAEDRFGVVQSANLPREGTFKFDFLPPGKYVVYAIPYNKDFDVLVQKTVDLGVDACVEVNLQVE